LLVGQLYFSILACRLGCLFRSKDGIIIESGWKLEKGSILAAIVTAALYSVSALFVGIFSEHYSRKFHDQHYDGTA
jgi:hypothetical protein